MVQVAVDAIDVVRGVEWVSVPRVVRDGARLCAYAPPVEQHYGDINASGTRLLYSVANAIEVSLVELRKIEFRLAVQCSARSSSLKWTGGEPVVGGDFRRPFLLLPNPEAEEVVTAGRQEVEVRSVVECRGRIARAVVLQVAPGVRPG